MTTTRVYKSSDAGAPSLTGVVSKMIDLLDAVLVNGYNSKTITITRSGDVATAACTSHGFRAEQVVMISGATPSDYNGEFRIISATTNDFTFEVLGSPTTPATGTITCLVAPAGWTKPYTGTNKAVFQNSVAAGGTGMLVRILDDASATGLARDAKAWVYSAMTDVDTGSDITPSAAVMANGVFFRKSTTADATARVWRIWADERTCYIHVMPDTTTAIYVAQSYVYAFGDFESYIAADGYGYFITGNRTSAASTSDVSGAYGTWSQAYISNAAIIAKTEPVGSYLPKRYLMDTGPTPCYALLHGMPSMGAVAASAHTFGMSSYAAFKHPEVISRQKLYAPIQVAELGGIRGAYRGLYAPLGDVGSVAPTQVLRETTATNTFDLVKCDVERTSARVAYVCFEALASWG